MIHPLESILYGVDFTPLLVSGELLTGTPTVAPVTGLTIGAPVVNTATFRNDAGILVAIGAGVQVRISGATDATDYTVTVSCATTTGNTRAVACPLECRAS
ncbi:MAG TPA: hypothetical protein VGH74_07510 [Planctomycetaceae bacterium]